MRFSIIPLATGLAVCGLTAHAKEKIQPVSGAVSARTDPAPDRADAKLWYDQPARQWMTEALPIGNGRMGAMLFGGVDEDRIQFNEESLWTGKPAMLAHANDPKLLAEATEAARKGDFVLADKLGKQIQATPHGTPAYREYAKAFGNYQAFGNVILDVKHPAGDTLSYRRQLDLTNAIGSVSYDKGGVAYRREYFASYPDQVIVVHLTANKPGQVSFRAGFSTPHKQAKIRVDNGRLILAGTLPDNGMAFEAQLAVRAKGGQVTQAGDALDVTGADEADLILTAATDYKNAAYAQHAGEKPDVVCGRSMVAALEKNYQELRVTHTSDYQALHRRCRLELKGADDLAKLPTDARLKRALTKPDPELEALIFQFGRYLLISSSRPGTMPANLQGIWNDSNTPPWTGDWHTDINVEMNYWPAEVTGLPECHLPLFALMKTLEGPGGEVAKRAFNARGWFCTVNTNPWGYCDNRWNWRGAAGWLCQHAWEHYLYTGDKAFLAETGYPLMKGAALCMLDGLVETDGKLVTGLAESPENTFQGKHRMSCGVAVDMQIAWELLGNCADAAKILGKDAELAKEFTDARARLAPPKIGRFGQLQEWYPDVDSPKDHHRHTSHLWAVYPGRQITPQETPKLAEAAEVSLVSRGKAANGWAFPWRSLIYARLLKTEPAYDWLKRGMGYTQQTAMIYDTGGGMYPNLLGACPPFQIDSNFGTTAAIAEMLLQSHRLADDGTPLITMLPALPKAWPDGKVIGLRARGGFTVDCAWQDGRLGTVILHGQPGTKATVRCGDSLTSVTIPAGGTAKVEATTP